MSAVQGVQGGRDDAHGGSSIEVNKDPLHTLHTPDLEAATALFMEAHRRYQAELTERIERAEAELAAMRAAPVRSEDDTQRKDYGSVRHDGR